MSDIFHEIEEDIRRERLDKLWEKHGSTGMIIAGALVIGVASYLWWGEATERRNAALSDEYLAASEVLASGDAEVGLTALDEIIANSAGGYVVLASMQKAASLAADGKTEEAIRAYDAIRSSNKTEDLLGQLAAIKAGWLLVESEDFANMKARLGDIAFAEAEGPWAAAATEVLAYSAVRAENLEEAEALYLKIRTMRSASMGIVGRSAEMLSIIGPQIVRPELAAPIILQPASESAPETEGAATQVDPGGEVEPAETLPAETLNDDTSTTPEGE